MPLTAWAWNDDVNKPFLTTYKTNQDNNSTCQEDYNSVWQIIKVENDNGYYFIRHCITGKYIVYNNPEYTNRKAFHLETVADPYNYDPLNNENNAYIRFYISYKGEAVNIRPKNLTSDDRFLNPSRNNFPYYYGYTDQQSQPNVAGLIGVFNNGNNDGSKWFLEVPRPIISYDNVSRKASISSTLDALNPNYDYYYTTDGSTPNISEQLKYNGPFDLTSSNPVKAIAVSTGGIKSQVATFILEQAATPVIQKDEANNCITITCPDEGATIYFTDDGSTPTIASSVYSQPLNFNYSQKPIKAIAAKPNMLISGVGTGSFTLKCPTPEIYPDFETNKVNLFCDAEAASIYYTLDGTTPTTNSTLYDGTPFPLPMSGTVKAFATGLPNCLDSDVSTYTITKAATPTIQADNGEAPRYITITTTTIGADIYYTIDGSDPTTESIRYTGPFREGPEHAHVSGVDIKAIAVKPGMFCSEVGNGNVTLTCEPPQITRTGANTFEISSTFPINGASIYYTTDGTNPSTSSTPYSEPFTHSVPCTIKAIVVATNYNDSPIAERSFTSDLVQENDVYLIQNDYDYTLFVAKANTTAGASSHYKLVANISAAGTSMVTTTFTGLFEGSADADGNFYTISDLDHPMFREINPGITDGTIPTNQGIVRNVILKDVNIANHEGNTGAIACEIRRGACIYNCGILSGSVGGTGNVGGLVGVLDYTVYDYNAGLKYHAFTRVLNCFSYANITQKGADNGTSDNSVWAAGIVGNNKYESKVHNYPFDPNNPKDCELKTAVINCMFYGDITTQHGVNIAPVFGNKRMSDLNEKDRAINRYDYFLDGAKFAKTFTTGIDQYKASWPADEKYLTHYEYYRSILNSNRLLCTSYVTGKSGENVYQDTALIAKWVRDESIAPYPILKKWGKYPSIINPDTERVWDTLTKQWMNRANALDYQGKSFGTLSVTVKSGEHRYTATVPEQTTIQLTITDIDTLHWDYGYYKVQLPYYNTLFGNVNSTDHYIRYGGNYTDYVVTGWKITMVNGQTSGATTFVENWEHGYNFADRTDKFRDLYSVSGRVYAQGGFYYVPEGVTSIEIEAYWGKAYYLRNKDQSIDRVSVTNPQKVGSEYTDYEFTPAGHLPSTFQGLPVYDSLQTAIRNLDDINTCPTVYDQAIVLVGNLQVMNKNKRVGSNLDGKLHPFTIMSADFDLDNEPDYCFQFQFRDQLQRWPIQPIRFDFLAVPELGLAIRHDDNAYAIGIFIPQGHFEITETAFMHTTQFEYDGVRVAYTVNGSYSSVYPLPNEIPGFIYEYTPNGNKTNVTVTYVKNEAPVILNGGQFEQIVIRHSENRSQGFAKYTSYILMGGHFRMKRFTPGAHTNRNENTKVRLCAVNCIGGEYPEFYLSGIYRPNINPNVSGFEQGNPHCYTNGGKFGMVAGAGYDKILGNVTFKIDHSIIDEFYGGGINGACTIGGNIDVTINNSVVGKYCGGPKVGNMTGQTVTTRATGTTFGQFYGGGNGGTNYYRDQAVDGNSWPIPDEVWREWERLSKINTNTNDSVPTIVYDPNDHNKCFNPLNTRMGKTKQYDATKGYHGVFEFEVFNNSNGLGNDYPTIRTYVHWVQFGTTRTGNVTNTLTNCTVLQDFYGGGNLGFVDGDVVSTLQGNTIIYGSAYGGGYSAAIPTFRCYDLSRPIFPTRDLSGVMHHGELETDSIPYVRNADNEDIYYEWIHETPTDWAISELSTDNPVFEYPEGSGKWYCYTTESLENLGVVSGNTTLNINGNTKIYGVRKVEVGENPEDVLYAGAAYGGGDESAVLGNTTVTVNGTAGLLVSNVYGGGNIAVTGGDSKVEIFKGTIGIMDESVGLPYTNSVGKFITGRVFAAGKGAYDPTNPESKHLGLVKGNSSLYMYGGHVLSCLYGGGEISNVGLTRDEDVTVIVEESGTSNEYTWPVAVPTTGGNATVTMTGGIIGIKRNNGQILQSHEIGNVYGSGQGDPNTNFNTWTNVNNASVHISGGRVWGSVFGGGEEGHVLGNAITTISGTNTIIGTSGETSYDGNVFGGGRGHQAIALTAGTIGGNATVRVLGGHIFGSVFGGGRNGSVGTYLVPENYTGLYGEMQAGNPNEHGLVNVYIGGEGQDGNVFIGHQSTSDHDRVGGNVYGGGKGVVENPLINPIAFEFARVRETHVNVAQAEGKQTFIEGSVFGSGEDGHIMGDTYVTIASGQIGGMEYNPDDPTLCADHFHGNVYGGGRGLDQWEDADHNLHYSETAGKVYGNTNVTITGGRICRNVFGGGNLASVGIPKDENSGTASILITGDAIIGVEPNSANRNGIVFGAGKGRAGHDFKDLSFVKNTNITITGNAKVLATVYGSGEDGHVREKTNILIGNATVNGNPVDGSNVVIGVNGVSGKEGNVYGAGRGIDLDEEGHYSPTAGEVGVSTKIEINNGWVKGSVYGGGRTASVGTDEALEAEDNTPADFPDFGHTTIIIGGNARIGTEDGDNGYVFGAGKGDAGSVFADLTNVFETNVTVKDNAQIYGSVFGGGEDGHVRSYSWTDPNNPNHTITKQGDTHVFIEGTSKIGADGAFGRRGNVYGGGRGIDQYVGNDGQLHYSPTAGLVVGNTHVTVAGGDVYQNVYGGGNKSIVLGNKTVNIKDGWVHRNIYGGSNEIPFDPRWMHPGLKTVNMTGGKAHKLFGCSHNTIDGDFRMFDGDLEVIGFIDDQGNHKLVYYNNQEQEYEGDVNDLRLEARTTNPTSFVNISGGYLYDFGDDDNPERGSIHGAGLAGIVYGSVIINIGANAIKNSPFREYNVDSADLVTELGLHGSVQQYAHQPSKLQVSGSVFGGADYYQSENNPGDWSLFNVKGYSNIYIDGKGYNMEEVDFGTSFAELLPKCMVIDGNLYGSGTHCESGDRGRNIIVRNYGTRINRGDLDGHNSSDPDAQWFHHSTRPMGTIQRCDNLVIDHSNFTFSGRPWLGHDDGNLYAVAKVDSCLYIADSSALTLGDGTAPAHMDSIRKLQSGYLVYDNHTTTYNVFSEKVVGKLDWGWIGVVDPTSGNANEMCFMDGLTAGNTLNKAQENIIIFNGPTKLWVRYHEWEKETPSSSTYVDRQYYGELKGFFRMLSPYKPRGIESFAYARPKIMDGSILPISHDHYNMADGGFLSYNIDYNDYLAPGYGSYLTGDYVNTNTLQYPYTNVIEVQLSKEQHPDLDVRDYRMWVMASAFDGNCWYVDGTRGWGRDIMKPETGETGSDWKYGWGLYPDKPKQSVSGVGGVYDGTYILDDYGAPSEVKFDYDGQQMPDHTESDIIFVVGPIKDEYEFIENVHNGMMNRHSDYELRLFRYPGGHLLSNSTAQNKYYDTGGGAPASPNTGLTGDATNGPGPNYGAMLDVYGGATENNPITLHNVYMDGLYGHTSIDRTYLKFKTTDFAQENVSKPMIVTHGDARLSLKGELTTGGELNLTTGSIVTRGYNNTDASGTLSAELGVYNYYLNSNGNYGDAINGGGLYVEPTATVSVEGLVKIFENKQNNKGQLISSNVFLPTFDKHLYINDMLSNATRIGITSPVKKSEPNYKANTFSPVAVADKNEEENSAIAQSAWTQNNLHDDLQWFFGRGFNLENGSHTTYYEEEISDYDGSFTTNKTLFFGWTWNNVVRSEPTDFAFNNIDSPHDLAWLISLVNGLNGQTKNALSGQTITQTTDLDMQQYIWVPVGSEKESTSNFAGNFEGRGHLIKNLTSRYIGIGDYRYEYNNYGMFGMTNGATINRTFLVDEHIEPNNMANLGGLIGMMEGANSLISNSEAAGIITSDLGQQMPTNACGGLVGFFIDGEIRNSMAMHTTTASRGYVGGLVGTASDPESGQHNVKLRNSFANTHFYFGPNVVGAGLMGNNIFASLKNCYSAINKTDLDNEHGATVSTLVHTNTGSVSQCYGNEGFPLNVNNFGGDDHISECTTYTPVISADELGYMYEDNKIVGDTALFARLTLNAWDLNPVNDSVYAHWARPALAEINGDLPVLLLGEFDRTTNYQGNFRSVGTYASGPALQYGGHVRDEAGNTPFYDSPELDGALERLEENDALFVYGDITTAPTVTPVSDVKISVYEHASIVAPGSLSSHPNTYVGITFDNSFGKAYSSPGINEGLGNIEEGGYPLPRDWHMFSSPLSDAPLGFDYMLGDINTNTTASSTVGEDVINYFNNPWESMADEFHWLTSAGSPECANGADNRYWMKTFVEGTQATDGYFPTSRGALFNDDVNSLFIISEVSDECPSANNYRYPYGMDLLTWTEPDYHWINFKRNGPNHWHSDRPHAHLDYKPGNASNFTGEENQNESILLTGRGYMASIAKPTLLQSHGILNGEDDLFVKLTVSGKYLKGWNLVGNPYHGYLNFNEVVRANSGTNGVLGKEKGSYFYVVYDADKYATKAYVYYPIGGSENGEYASQYLHPHQGFYVKAAKTGNLVFNESMIVARNSLRTNADGHFRGSSWDDDRPAYPLVNLYLSSRHGCADVTVIEFERPEWNGALKMKELRQGNGLFYAQHDNTHYAALFTEKGAERVPLWFEAKEDDIFTIKWRTANGDFQSMYLIDNLTGTTYDMLANDSYTFQGHVGDYPSRFYIVFKLYEEPDDPEEPEEPEGEGNSFVFFDGSEWVVTGDGMLDFIDVQGRILWHSRLSGGQSRVSVPLVAAGVYMFRLTNGEEVKMQKVIVTNY